VLRTTGFLESELAERVADWFMGPRTAPAGAVWQSYRALAHETARPAAFTELVGAVTAYVVTGEKPGLRADLPPLDLYDAPT
jgi:hypothetical protein